MWLASKIYGLIIHCRNWLYDKGVLKSYKAVLPTICIGNLAVGGTGKTPHTEHFARLLTNSGYKVAILSRGYRRKTKGFRIVDANSTAAEVGDEPLQMYKKTGVIVAVSKDRLRGVRILKDTFPDLQLVLLDDAMQYRRLIPSLTIMLTAADNLYTTDKMLPLGRLRDEKQSVKRANMVIVSNVCDNLPQTDNINNRVFFSKIRYENLRPLLTMSVPDHISKPLIVTGIAQPKSMIEYLRNEYKQVKVLKFADHHTFNSSDYKKIFGYNADYIITTEKDSMRLSSSDCPKDLLSKTFVLPISVECDEADKFLLERVSELFSN